jgi:hypothetical protein
MVMMICLDHGQPRFLWWHGQVIEVPVVDTFRVISSIENKKLTLISTVSQAKFSAETRSSRYTSELRTRNYISPHSLFNLPTTAKKCQIASCACLDCVDHLKDTLIWVRCHLEDAWRYKRRCSVPCNVSICLTSGTDSSQGLRYTVLLILIAYRTLTTSGIPPDRLAFSLANWFRRGCWFNSL